jgi:hypothetical protein
LQESIKRRLFYKYCDIYVTKCSIIAPFATQKMGLKEDLVVTGKRTENLQRRNLDKRAAKSFLSLFF